MEETNYNTETIVADPMVPTLYRVENYVKETSDTFTLAIAPSGSAAEIKTAKQKQLDAAPGQFNMLYVFGMGEVPVSISASPAGGGLLTHTTRDVGSVTKALSALKVGDMLGVRGPFGTSWPVERAVGKDVVLVAGGIGLAPLRPVIHELLARRNDFGRVVVLYGSRSPADIIFKNELKKWKAQPGVIVYVTVDRGSTSWHGSVGVVTRLIPKIRFDPANAIVMICGPEIMMHYTVDALKQRGMSGEDIYVSMERNMKCAVGFCGHCQFGEHFICKDGPVFPYDRLSSLFRKPEI
ncbi:FAD/NAD(P)-binding protein [Mucilaginibacter sp.]|uniref:FAD/NAD(P)-binding protein n=1 Tax=Mucilaginibacter sp. TaxID=1882438 RepID=UPI00284C3409|nr:FAD/NAD(P)-binding protein [Mucilaginibacter sp.]MDR3695940.1 FAD/NAD(P)-binding protein [Mucilaginibacter sp.]